MYILHKLINMLLKFKVLKRIYIIDIDAVHKNDFINYNLLVANIS
jgi:hypothetical protein